MKTMISRMMHAAVAALLLLCCQSDEPTPEADTVVIDAGADTGPEADAVDTAVDTEPDVEDLNCEPGATARGSGFRSSDRPNFVVVTADDLLPAALEHARYRQEGGYRVALHTVSDLVDHPCGDPDKLRKGIDAALEIAHHQLEDDELLYLLLFGDAPEPTEPSRRQIPALGCTNQFGVCVTDNIYGDLDGDSIPDVAVGRIPARSIEQASAFLAKLKAFEAGGEPGLWNRRLVLYTGEANFGADIDAMIESMVLEGLTRVDHSFDVVGAYDNPTSDYYYMPFEDKVIELINGGSVAAIYIGHGDAQWTQGLPMERIGEIDCAQRLPFALFFACSNGAYEGPADSIAEATLWLERGPIASFASSDISHPYGNAVLAYEVQRTLLDPSTATFGASLMEAKRESMTHVDDVRDMIDAFALMSGEVEAHLLGAVRREHLNLYNLFGDPATSMRYPKTRVLFDPIAGSVKEGNLTVSGETPGLVDGQAWVTLESERDEILGTLDPVDPADPNPAAVQSNWDKAINKVVTGVAVAVQDGRFEATLTWSESVKNGSYYVKVYANSRESDSFGYVDAPWKAAE